MKDKDLVQRVRESVIRNLLKKANGVIGSDLNDVKLSIIEVKDILYSTLMDIEIDEVKERWGR